MGAILIWLCIPAAFIGTIFAFRAANRIHKGEDYTYESVACAVCVTLIVFVMTWVHG